MQAAEYQSTALTSGPCGLKNKGEQDSGVISELNAADIHFRGADPVLKGIYGDGGGRRRPVRPI